MVTYNGLHPKIISNDVTINGTLTTQTIVPLSDSAYNIGTTTVGFANVFMDQLHSAASLVEAAKDLRPDSGAYIDYLNVEAACTEANASYFKIKRNGTVRRVKDFDDA